MLDDVNLKKKNTRTCHNEIENTSDCKKMMTEKFRKFMSQKKFMRTFLAYTVP